MDLYVVWLHVGFSYGAHFADTFSGLEHIRAEECALIHVFNVFIYCMFGCVLLYGTFR